MTVKSARQWGSKWRGRVVVLLTDNSPNADTFNMARSRQPLVRELVKELYELAELHGFVFMAVHVDRQHNTQADGLSNCPDRLSALVFCSAHGLTLLPEA